MKAGAGVHCCPKPCLHPHEVEEAASPFLLEPCAFYNRWYDSYDVVMASCWHFYHPFCITKLAESQNSCVTCKEVFAPTWWTSFGFQKMQLEDDAARLALDKSAGELSDTLEYSFGIRSPMCKYPQSLFFFNSATGLGFDWTGASSPLKVQRFLGMNLTHCSEFASFLDNFLLYLNMCIVD
jgi:hypothetical protein